MIRIAFTGLFVLAALAAHPARAQAPAYPQEVQSCFDRVRFGAAPKRPVVNDFNMTQTVLDMGLAPNRTRSKQDCTSCG
jgi:iron complex transport system substrate-binding protein